MNKKLGLKDGEEYLCHSRMGGAGIIECKDCGYQEEIVDFVHGFMMCDIGRQCPHCYAFVVEHYNHELGEKAEDFVCPECGTVIRKKEESILKGNDDPLFCPKCHSARLVYHMSYIT